MSMIKFKSQIKWHESRLGLLRNNPNGYKYNIIWVIPKELLAIY